VSVLREYFFNSSVTIFAEYRDPLTNQLTDPDKVFFDYQKPGGSLITKQWTINSEVVRESLGKFYIDIPADTPGTWKWGARATNAADVPVGAWEGKFKVLRTQF